MEKKIDDIGKLFHKRRKELGLTQEQVAEKVGVSKSEISKIENGRPITFSTINKISEALNVATEVDLKSLSTTSSDIIHYIVMSLGMFARKYNLTKKECFSALSGKRNIFKHLLFAKAFTDVFHFQYHHYTLLK